MKSLNYYNQRSYSRSIIIILTHARIKESKGKYLPTVSNSWNGSKLLINEDIVDIQDFKKGYDASDLGQASSQTLSQMTGYSQFSEHERFMSNAMVKSISEINSLTNTGEITCITIGTTAMFLSGKNGWYYEGCTQCTKKAEAKDGPFTCKDSYFIQHSVSRYKLEIKVVHKKGSGKFIFWDSQCVEIIGMSALELTNKMLAEGEDYPKAYPEPLDKMLGLTLAP